MANALDIGLFEYFEVIFPFILATVLVYALLQKTKFVSENASINAIIGLVSGVLLMLSSKAILVVKFITPWFVLLFIFLMLMLMLFKMFGATDEDIRQTLMGGKHGDDKTIPYWVIIISSLVLVVGLGAVYGPDLTPITDDTQDGDGFEAAAWSAFFHPKVIGLIFISLVGVFTIKLLAGETVKPQR